MSSHIESASITIYLNYTEKVGRTFSMGVLTEGIIAIKYQPPAASAPQSDWRESCWIEELIQPSIAYLNCTATTLNALSWKKLKLRVEQLNEGELGHILLDITQALVNVGLPAYASVFGSIAGDAMILFVSPKAVEILGDFLTKYDAVPCPPPSPKVSYMAGDIRSWCSPTGLDFSRSTCD